jgi:hypothetical protein
MVSGQDEYTPIIEEVREDYVAANTRHYDAYLTGIPLATAQEVFRGDFDRMIEQVRREAAAEQRKKDARIAVSMTDNESDGYYGQACYEVASAIREAGSE